LLARLHEAGVIRQTKIRELWFLAQAASELLLHRQLSQMFDPFDGPVNPDELFDRMTDTIVRGLLA